jgi:large subunit ribosomal protein L11
MVEKTLKFIVPGGKASGGPPIGPALGPLGLNIMSVVNKINEETAEYDGTPVPIDLTIDTDTKEFIVKVGMLSSFALITQALNIEGGSSNPNIEYVGDLSFKQLVEVAKRKREGLYSTTLKAAVKEVVGTCQSMGVTIEGTPAKEMQKLILSGQYDVQLSEAT